MSPVVMQTVDGLLRWIHVIAGVAWIGHLYFFNFVNAQVAKTYDADSKKKVVPELMPRALYFFRWGAAYTWFTGALLIGVVYNMRGMMDGGKLLSGGASMGAGWAIIALAFFVYDMLWKSPLGKNEKAAAAVSFALVAGAAMFLWFITNGRAAYIHLGAMFGTIMAMNVWMRIWPAQRKIIAGIKGTGPAADASVAAMATLRSKHNTYLSIPLLFLMASNHFTAAWGNAFGWVWLLAFVAAGFGIAKFLFVKSASKAPTTF